MLTINSNDGATHGLYGGREDHGHRRAVNAARTDPRQSGNEDTTVAATFNGTWILRYRAATSPYPIAEPRYAIADAMAIRIEGREFPAYCACEEGHQTDDPDEGQENESRAQ